VEPDRYKNELALIKFELAQLLPGTSKFCVEDTMEDDIWVPLGSRIEIDIFTSAAERPRAGLVTQK